MTGMIRRGLRLKLVAGLVIALAMPAFSGAAANTRGVATTTTLNTHTSYKGASALTIIDVAVTPEDGVAATGAVAIDDGGSELAGAALNAQGHTTFELSLPAGNHTLRATYRGDATHRSSTSPVAEAQTETGTSTPDFQISVVPATVSLTVGQAGTVIASVTPVNSAALTAPMFVTLSCSGLPDQSTCNFTPENVEVLANATAALTSSMVIQTQTASFASAKPSSHPVSNSVAWAFLLPGALALGGLAWSTRGRSALHRMSLLGLVAVITLLGTTACNPRYNYEHHGPPINPATPAGTYTVMVTAQSSNGVEAITHSIPLALTVK